MLILKPGGQPSIIPPIYVPCDSPNVVRLKNLPNEFPLNFVYLIIE